MTGPPLSVIGALRALAPSGPEPGPLPDLAPALARLRALCALSPFELDLVLLATLPEIDDGWGDLFARLGSSWRRPTLGLALRALIPDPGQRARLGPTVDGSAPLRHGLVRLGLPELPRPDRPLRASPVVAAFLLGSVPAAIEDTGAVRAMEPVDGEHLLRVREPVREAVERIGDGPALVEVRRGAAAIELAIAIAARRGRAVLRVASASGGADTMRDVLLLADLTGDVVCVEARPEVIRWIVDDGPQRGIVLLAPPADGRVIAGVGLRLQSLDLPAPTPLEMAALWRALAPELADDSEALDPLANQTRLGLADLRRAVDSARIEAAAAGRALAAVDLQRAVSHSRPDPSPALARTTRPQVPWDALVAPEHVQSQLDELRARVVHRVTVHYRWGLAAPSGRGDGVIALLHGDSGVGKTFAAEVLASAFSLPLVKVDLSRVVSKYIGETEKNLEAVFASSEGFGSVLMFDEADAMFGKRTGVRDAHDRYANIETNYLLQRLETFEGVAVLSTNLLHNIDDAFLRRLQLVIHLPRPTAPLRRQLWERSLPVEARGAELDLGALATRFDLVGGEIRNAALRAAYLAATAGTRVTAELALDAIRLELAKKGRPFPA